MQAAGTTAKQINVIVCSHMCWQGARLFGEEKVSCPWEEEGGWGENAPTMWPCATVTKLNIYCKLLIGKLLLCFHTLGLKGSQF